MALNNTTADAVAQAICTALGVVDVPTINKYKLVYETLYAALKADIAIVLAANAVVTTGSSTTQQGPAAPITINPL